MPKRDEWNRLIRKGRAGKLTIRLKGRVVGTLTHRKVKGRWRWEIETRDGVRVWHEDEMTCKTPPSSDN